MGISENISSEEVIRIFGVPMDLGQQRRGVDMGPSAVRYAGLQERLQRLGYTVHDGGNISVAQHEEIETEKPSPEKYSGKAHFLHEVALVCRRIYKNIVNSLEAHERVIFLGGDHSMSIGTVSGVAHKYDNLGVIWVDAHADINTPETSPSGNIHGMPVAVLLGEGPKELTHVGYATPKLRPEQMVMIGIRDLDEGEKIRLREKGIAVFTTRDIDEQGMARVSLMAIDRLRYCDCLHVSLDLDSLDPDVAPGVGTPVPGGLTYREAHLLMEILADTRRVHSMDIVEINPILDNRNTTAQIAVELTASLFGQRIL